MPDELTIQTGQEGIFVFNCPTEMHWEQRDQFVETLSQAMGTGSCTGVIIDLDGVEFISSAALGGIFALRKHLKEQGAKLVVARPSVTTRRLLSTINMEALMPVVGTLEEAHALLDGGS